MRRDRTVGPDFSALQGRRVLIALSGGADSVALAAMLAEARPELELTLFAAHLDHAIRPESAADAEWCRELCRRLDIPFHTRRVDVPAEAARAGEGLETAARRVRYSWLRQLRERLGADCIALAHHMDDQAETVLMHLARGAGPEGACGMSPRAGDLVRPLLGMRKRELTAYLQSRGLSWREDATNALADTPRNALRLHGIPELEKSYPGFVPALARYARAARIESDYVAEQTRVWMARNAADLPCGRLLRLDEPPHPALLRRAIRALCDGGISADRLNEIAALADARRGSVNVSAELRVERGRRGLYFLQGTPPTMREAMLPEAGSARLGGLCEIHAAPAAPIPVRDDPLRQALDAEALRGATLRTRRPGDRIRPLGCGDKLLSDYFTDRGVDRPLRDCVALVARGTRILWVCGLGVSEDAKLAPHTRKALLLECRYDFDSGLLNTNR